jgi:hypothetical protein
MTFVDVEELSRRRHLVVADEKGEDGAPGESVQGAHGAPVPGRPAGLLRDGLAHALVGRLRSVGLSGPFWGI